MKPATAADLARQAHHNAEHVACRALERVQLLPRLTQYLAYLVNLRSRPAHVILFIYKAPHAQPRRVFHVVPTELVLREKRARPARDDRG